jgi:N-acetylmuramoyl-L-alanine amidase
MPDDNRFRDDEDREFQEWLKNRPTPEEDIPASVAFMEMMRQAAARRQPQTEATVDDDVPHDDAPPVEPPSADDAVPVPPAAPAATQRRPRRRKERRGYRTVGILGGIIRSFIIVITAAGLTATIFTWWTPSKFITSDVREELSVALATSIATLEPTALPTPNWARRVGVVSGHRGPQNDPGAVCPDGLTEASINETVATAVVRNLRGRGYTVDLLDEFDPRLDNYQAAALLSIHSNTCQDFGEVVSGYLIAAAAARITSRGTDDLLVDCVSRHYALASGLERREGVTVDMTDYHTFREIHPQTPAAIIELGFLLADRRILTEETDTLAQGITDGLICFLEPGSFQDS